MMLDGHLREAEAEASIKTLEQFHNEATSPTPLPSPSVLAPNVIPRLGFHRALLYPGMYTDSRT